MYALADTRCPTRTCALARATLAEMALAGITCVGEFHYLHHGPAEPYGDPNAMGAGADRGRRDAGIRITLLDTCYLAGGFGAPLEGAQARFSDGDAHAWAERVSALATTAPHARIGAAIHSVRAVPRGPARDGRGLGARARGAAARPPVRAARRERGVPRRPRPHPGRAARRRTARSGRARPRSTPPTSPTTTSRRLGGTGTGLHVRDHRARPRRRHRPGPRARRRRRAAVPPAATATP